MISTKRFAFFLIFYSLHSFAQLSNDVKNKHTRYVGKKPAGVCFENSVDRYRIKKKHTVSDLMNYFQLRPLWCPECSVDTAQSINNLKDVDTVLPGQILTIPQKCENFSWKDDFNYDAYLAQKNSDPEAQQIFERRNTAQQKINTTEIKTQDHVQMNSPTAVNTTQTSVPKKEYLRTTQKLGAEPFALYSEDKITSDTLAATLRSDLSMGLRFSYEKEISDVEKIYGYATMYNTEIKDDIYQYQISNNKKLMTGFGAGYKYYLNPSFSATAEILYKDDIYLEQPNLNTISVEKSQNTLISIRPDYTFYQKKQWNVSTHVDLGALLPMQTYGGKTDLGYQAGLGVGSTYKINWGKIFAGADFGFRNQKNSTYEFSEKFLVYKTGLFYLF
jgi:Protein of unknown function (DUF3187)